MHARGIISPSRKLELHSHPVMGYAIIVPAKAPVWCINMDARAPEATSAPDVATVSIRVFSLGGAQHARMAYIAGYVTPCLRCQMFDNVPVTCAPQPGP